MMNTSIIAIIQARMGSSRLPGKVLLDLAGTPMLGRVVQRTQQSRLIDQTLVATTTEPEDDAVAAYCTAQGYPCTRGSLHDVLDRYYQAALQSQAGIIVRITADCPLIDPMVIDQTICAFLGVTTTAQARHKLNNGPSFPYDFAANRLPPPWNRTFPIGLDVEVCHFKALQRAWLEADQVYHREHVFPYLYENADYIASTVVSGSPYTNKGESFTVSIQPNEKRALASHMPFNILLVNHDPDYGSLRWTVDTPEDLTLIRLIYNRLSNESQFSWLDILDLFQQEPELSQINANVEHHHYRDVDPRHAEHSPKSRFST